MEFEKRLVHHRGITVIQKLDPAMPRLRPGKAGIVLAGGAVAGGAFKAGGLRALDEAFLRRRLPGQATPRSFSLKDFDMFIGLSAGSVLAAVLSAGISPDELLRIMRGTSETYDPFRPWHFMRPNALEWISRLGLFLDREQEILTNYLSGATNASSGARFDLPATLKKMAEATARLLPTGFFDVSGLEDYLRRTMRRTGLTDDFREAYRRTGKGFYLTAAELNRGEQVVFGHDEPYARVPISKAIAASCALPVWYRPVAIINPRAGEPGEPDHLDLVDGSILHTADVRLAVEKGCELVICYNPFTRIRYDRAGRSLYEHGLPTLISQVARTLIGARLDITKDLLFHDDNTQADIVFIEPAEDDYTFFNMNPLNFWNKERAAAHGYDAVSESVQANHEILAQVFRHHGIELRPPRADVRPAAEVDEPRAMRAARHRA